MSDAQIQSRSSATPIDIASPVHTPTGIIPRIRRFYSAARRLQERERERLREEIAQIPGLMALLMKPRNGQKWTKDERDELRIQLRRLSRLGLYLMTAIIPGTTLTLPLLAWWLDQRQLRRS